MRCCSRHTAERRPPDRCRHHCTLRIPGRKRFRRSPCTWHGRARALGTRHHTRRSGLDRSPYRRSRRCSSTCRADSSSYTRRWNKPRPVHTPVRSRRNGRSPSPCRRTARRKSRARRRTRLRTRPTRKRQTLAPASSKRRHTRRSDSDPSRAGRKRCHTRRTPRRSLVCTPRFGSEHCRGRARRTTCHKPHSLRASSRHRRRPDRIRSCRRGSCRRTYPRSKPLRERSASRSLHNGPDRRRGRRMRRRTRPRHLRRHCRTGPPCTWRGRPRVWGSECRNRRNFRDRRRCRRNETRTRRTRPRTRNCSVPRRTPPPRLPAPSNAHRIRRNVSGCWSHRCKRRHTGAHRRNKKPPRRRRWRRRDA
jgi:hypothetical protein